MTAPAPQETRRTFSDRARRFANRMIFAGVLGLIVSLVVTFALDQVGWGALLLLTSALAGVTGVCLRVVFMRGSDGGGAWGGDAGGGL